MDQTTLTTEQTFELYRKHDTVPVAELLHMAVRELERLRAELGRALAIAARHLDEAVRENVPGRKPNQCGVAQGMAEVNVLVGRVGGQMEQVWTLVHAAKSLGLLPKHVSYVA
jgi:hypothetical protein